MAKQKMNIAEEIETLKKMISRERQRVNRLVQVLRNNLPEENLQKVVDFTGTDCCGEFHLKHYMTLDAFLRNVVDP